MSNNKVKKLSGTLIYIFVLTFALCYTIIYPDRMIKSCYHAVIRCVEVVVPSLFFPMCIAQIIIKTGIYKFLCLPLGVIFKFLKLSDEEISVFIMSNISGYPIGALMITQLYNEKKIGKIDAERMLTFCYAPSPSFVISLIGIIVFNNKFIGILIYISNVIVNFILLLIYSFSRKNKNSNTSENNLDLNIDNVLECIYLSTKSIFKICSIIVFFSVMIDGIGIVCEKLEFNSSILKCVFEISLISEFINNYSFLGYIAPLFSFGGLCVLFQIKSLCKGISLNKFFVSRIYVIAMNMLVSNILFDIFDEKVYLTEVFAYTRLVKNNNYLSTICVLFMIIMFFLKKPLVKSEIT